MGEMIDNQMLRGVFIFLEDLYESKIGNRFENGLTVKIRRESTHERKKLPKTSNDFAYLFAISY
jgi:hypothetical protein